VLERDIKKVFFFIFVSVLFLSCATSDPYGVYHRVKKGETLYSIAKLYGVSVDKIEKENIISDAKKLRVGQQVFVPGVAAPLEMSGKTEEVHSNAKKDKPKDEKKAAKQPDKVKKAASADIKPVKPGAYIWPVKGVVTSKFGPRWGKNHSGIDIGCPIGTPVYASAAGTAVFVGEKGGYGFLIVLQHPDGSFTIYAHNSKNIVKEHAKVKQGEKIAEVGSTGNSTGPHLHFEIRLQSKPVDPLQHLPKTVP